MFDLINKIEDDLIESKSIIGVCMSSADNDVSEKDLKNSLYHVYGMLDNVLKEINNYEVKK